MEEKIYSTKKNGMPVLIVCILALIAGMALTVYFGIQLDENKGNTVVNGIGVGVGIVLLLFGWFPLIGLKVLKPNEALVLTLFGKYVGTLKGDGFYAVNPF
ncbi:MAG: SPFH domain-containing protein, partial [Clostridia bacterium]|nr:SPFH domain-containing protein [Clostridia bacterium]